MRWPWLLALVACGRLDFDALQRDANSGDPDGTRPLTCSPWAPPYHFIGPQVATTSNDWDPSFGPDGLLIFSSDRAGAEPILFRGFPDGNGDFTNVIDLGLQLPATSDLAPSWSGRRLYFSSTRGGSLRLWQSDLSDQGVYSPPVMVSGLESTEANGVAIVGDEMIFNNGYDTPTDKLYRAVRDAGDHWTVDRELDELNTVGDGFATLSSDHLTIMIESIRSDGVHSHIFTATRPEPTARFGPVTPVAELDTGQNESDGDPELSRDGRTLYFSSDRAGGAGEFDLWRATRTCQ